MSKSSLVEAFDDTAERYAEARPSYPECIVDRIVEYGQLTQESRILEIGTGTGKATLGFARRGLRIVGLEPGRRLVEIAQALLGEHPRVQVHCATFEEWTAAPRSYDLIFAAQSYHWTKPEMRTSKSAELLAPGGTLAIFGSWAEVAANPLREQLDAAYARHAPELRGVDPARDWYGSSDVPALEELRASGRFTDVVYECFPWERTLSSELYRDLLRTYSFYWVLLPERLDALLEEVSEVIRANGGDVTLGYKTGLILARAQDGPRTESMPDSGSSAPPPAGVRSASARDTSSCAAAGAASTGGGSSARIESRRASEHLTLVEASPDRPINLAQALA